MVVAKIQQQLLEYGKWLNGVKQHPRTHVWESVQHFQLNWDLAAADKAAMFDKSLYNSETRRLWQTEHWEPKRAMQSLWQYNPATVALMFEDLFQESRELEARVGRFLFGSDLLLRDYKRDHPRSVENNHYHDDYKMISLYLTFQYPDSYAPYALSSFQQLMPRLGARDIPQENDFPRYAKAIRTLRTFYEKEPALAQKLRAHLHPKRHYQGNSLLFTWDFCQFVAHGA
jgi:hypothetical protein